MSRGLALASACLLCACTPRWELESAGRIRVNDLYSVETSLAWSSLEDGDTLIWTVDGTTLQVITFYNGIAHGETLYDEPLISREKDRERRHRFRTDMDAFEVQELLVNTILGLGWQAVEASNLRPEPLGPFDGFRFDLDYQAPSGLEYRGRAACAVVDERLYAVAFTAARIHSYDRYLPHFESIVASIRRR